jgi:hypothetical protein
MKTIFLSLAMFLAASLGVSANTTNEPVAAPVPVNERMSDQEVNRLVDRVKEIRDMDLKNLSAKQKKELRNELKEMQRVTGGVYIGGAALVIIIVLLLILLL